MRRAGRNGEDVSPAIFGIETDRRDMLYRCGRRVAHVARRSHDGGILPPGIGRGANARSDSRKGVTRQLRGLKCGGTMSGPPNVLSLSRHVPSRAGQTDTRICEARGAEAPDQRTARGRLL